ncbi:MAG: hypothetical protein LH615_07495 [Ferruginibacter sp.]|nr:hypothetical protein [Ferruginibacter sp.]
MENFIKYLDFIAPFFALVFFFLNREVLKEKAIKYMGKFLVVQLIFNGVSIGISIIMKGGNNHIFFHLNCLWSFYFILSYFKEINILNKKYLLFVLFITLYIGYLIIEDGFLRFNSIGFSLASLIIIILCFKYYYFLLKNPQLDNFFYSHNFWITTGLFTYYVCNFIIFMTFGYLTKIADHVGYLWRFHNVVFFILCIYLIKGALCKKKELISF